MRYDLLLVDDDPELTDSLGGELSALCHRVTVAGDAREAFIAIARSRFDAIILDRMLPRTDGISVLEGLRKDGIRVPIIMLTALSQSFDKIAGLEAGADDYVAKPASAEELIARITAIIRGRNWVDQNTDTLHVGNIIVSPMSFRAWRNGHPIELGRLETRLLIELVRNAGAVLTRAMLVERVWEYDFDPKSNIVDVYIRRLRLKLIEAGGDDPIQTIRGVGYMLQTAAGG